jgi:hypothetical protein
MDSSGSAAPDFVAMTPNFWHLDDSWEKEVATLDVRRLTIAVFILRFRRTDAPGV